MASVSKWVIPSALAIALCTILCCTCPPVPSITSISPTSATAGGSQFVLTVNGDDFRDDSVVKWNGSLLVTSFVNSQQLIASVTAADITQPGTVLVFVFNPPETGTTSVSGAIGASSTTTCSGKTSNSLSFTVKP